MAQIINSNILSLKIQTTLNKSQSVQGTAIERLSSGLRINSAADDAAGESIANRFTASIRGLNQAARGASDGISMTQTAEGALNEVNNNLQRIRQLTLQAQNATNSISDLQSIQAEIDQRISEIERISQDTQFNNLNLMANDNTLSIQVGANDEEKIDIHTKAVNGQTLNLDRLDVVKNPRLGGAVDKTVITTTTVTIPPPAPIPVTKATVEQITDGTTVLDPTKAVIIKYNLGGTVKHTVQLSFASGGAPVKFFPITSWPVPVGGKVSFDISKLTNVPLTAMSPAELVAIKAASVIHVGDSIDVPLKPTAPAPGPTPVPVVVEKDTPIRLKEFIQNLIPAPTTADGSRLFNDDSKVHYLFDANGKPTGNYVLSASDGNFYNISISPAGLVTLVPRDMPPQLNTKVVPMKTLDSAMNQVDSIRSELGSVQNRLASAINNINNTVNNLSSARSRIEDSDYAVEVSNSTRAQILQSASDAVLTIANQSAQSVLKLLKEE